MITYGKGGWTWSDLYYNIPVYLRNFYLAEMSKSIQKEREATERSVGNVIKREAGKTTIEPPVKPFSGK